MANKLILKRSSVASKVPLATDLEPGELAVNLADQKLYSKKSDGTVILVGSGLGGTGDVQGPASSTDNALARFDGTTGKIIQNSSATLDDSGNLKVLSLTTDRHVNSTGRVLTYDFSAAPSSAVGDLDGYFDVGEALELFAFVATGDSQNYYVEGTVKIQSAASVETLFVRAAIRSDVRPQYSWSGQYERYSEADYLTCTPVFWVNETTGTGEIRLVLKFVTGNIQDIECSFKVFQRDNYGSALTVTTNHISSAVPTNFVEYSLNKRIDLTPAGLASNVFVGALSGNAATATKLATARTINGVSFDGTANIDIAFANLTSKPTTLSGYGITDAAPSSHVGSTGTAHGNATTAVAGFMSSVDKTKLDGIASGATANTGTVTSVSGTGTASGLTLSGTVTSSGSLTLSGTVNALAAGTYGISISGNAATATNADTLDGQHGSYYQPASTAITTSNIGSQSVNYATSSGSTSYSAFSGDAVAKDNITTRTDSGFYESSTGTNAEGWPVNDSAWQHMIACTHSNNANYYSMQIGGSFYDNTFYGRKTNGSGTTGWVQFLTSGNYNSYSPTLTGTGASGTWGINVTGYAKYLSGAPAYTNGTDGWWRSAGQAGWYNSDYAVGIYATEAGNVRTYNGANFIAAGNVTAYSDERLKENWRNLPVDFVEQLAGVKCGIYDRIDTEFAKTQVGVSAQSLQNVMPNAIIEDSEGILSVAYGNAALAACVELAKEVVALRAEIEALKATK